jgi:membrane protein YdbS with pleckstrin-like domain
LVSSLTITECKLSAVEGSQVRTHLFLFILLYFFESRYSLCSKEQRKKVGIVGRQFLIIIIIIKLILLKIRVRNVKFQIYEWQRAIGNGVLTKRVTATPLTQFSQTQTLNSHKHK